METADYNAKELQETPAAIVNLSETLPKDRLPMQGQHITKALGIAVTTVEENTLHQIADFVNGSASSARI